jgi:Tfp pilus assembly protein PilN
MRAVNLIPPEERGATPSASGAPAAAIAGYAIIAFLVIAIGVVFYLNSLSTKIDEHKSEQASLEAQLQQTQARAAALQPYVQLANVTQARTVTIDSLAKSRFDWQRVLRELARVTPATISLSNVTGTVSADVGVEGGAEISLRDDVQGPALEIEGCARNQRKVADYVSSLHDIDGVTRVAALNSARPDRADSGQSSGNGTTSDSAAPPTGSGTCARATDAAFQVVAAFDPVQVPSEPQVGSSGSVAVSSAGTAATSSNDGGVAAEQASQAQQQQEISNASQRSQDATNLVPGG